MKSSRKWIYGALIMRKSALLSLLSLAIPAMSALAQTANVDDPVPVQLAAPESVTEDKSVEIVDLSPALYGIEAAIRELIAEEDKLEQVRIREQSARDLEAQEGMARWAKWMFWATAATVLLTGAALYTIVRTLHYTRIAADYSKDMVVQAEEATKAALVASKAAQHANDFTQRASELDTRAYLVAENVKLYLGVDDNTAFVSINLRNVGKSPAYNILAVRFLISDDRQKIVDFDGELPSGNIEFRMVATLVPGASEVRRFPVFLDQTFDSDLRSTENMLAKYIDAMMAYQTIYDRAAKRFSGELSLYIGINEDDIKINENALDETTPNSGVSIYEANATFRSAWMDKYLSMMALTYDKRIFEDHGPAVSIT